MMKKALFLFFVILIMFNILNIIDKITTYYGIKQGFWEQNVITSKYFNLIGVLPTLALQFFLGLIASFSIFLAINYLSKRANYITKLAIIPTIFISLIYFEAVINNMRLLL